MSQNQFNGLTQMIIGVLMILVLIKMLSNNKLICRPVYQDNIEVLQCQYK